MELEFRKTSCKYLRSALREVRNQELTKEMRLSDGMPDIGRVLASWGQVILRSKEWRSDAIGCAGGVMIWVLYAPEDGTDARCVEGWIPFQMDWDLPSGISEGTIHIAPLLRFVDARSVSARKLMVRTGVAVRAEAMVQEETQIPVPDVLEDDIQLLHKVYPLRMICEVGEKSFQVDEDLVLPDSIPKAEKILHYSVNPEVTENRVSGKRLIVKGEGNLHVLYRSEDGRLYSWDFDLPFSQLINLETDWEEDPQAMMDLCVTGLELSLDNTGHLRLKLDLLAQFRVSCRQMVRVITDAYSTNREVQPVVQQQEMPVILDSRQENIYGEQTLPQRAETVVDVCFLPDFPRMRRMGEQVELEVPGQFQVLFYGEGGVLQSANSRWEGSLRISAHEDGQVHAVILPGSEGHATLGNDQIYLKPEVVLCLETQSQERIPMATGMEIGQVRIPDPNRPSLILRRVGEDGLWTIAKGTGTTVSAIMDANGLTGEPLENQMLLIPVN